MAKVVAFTVSPTKRIGFIVESNKDKTFKQFSEHEKHHGLSKEQLREVYDLIQLEAGNSIIREDIKQEIEFIKTGLNAVVEGMKEVKKVEIKKEAPAPEPGLDDTAAG